MRTIWHRNVWPRAIVIIGNIAMLLGALDPLEGSVAILIGSAFVALGTFLDQNPDQHRFCGYRSLVLVLIATGVGAMWTLSDFGGIGGGSGHSMWWGLLILPYLVGWSMGIWGPGNPRWVLLLGIVNGLWFLTLCGMVLSRPTRPASIWVGFSISTAGLATIFGCLHRLRHFHSLAAKP
jgi:hypothetical protein